MLGGTDLDSARAAPGRADAARGRDRSQTRRGGAGDRHRAARNGGARAGRACHRRMPPGPQRDALAERSRLLRGTQLWQFDAEYKVRLSRAKARLARVAGAAGRGPRARRDWSSRPAQLHRATRAGSPARRRPRATHRRDRAAHRCGGRGPAGPAREPRGAGTRGAEAATRELRDAGAVRARLAVRRCDAPESGSESASSSPSRSPVSPARCCRPRRPASPGRRPRSRNSRTRSAPVRPEEPVDRGRRARCAQLRGLPAHPGNRPGAARPGAAPTGRPAVGAGGGTAGTGRGRGRAAAALTREAIAAYERLLAEQPQASGAMWRSTSCRGRTRAWASPSGRSARLDQLVAGHPDSTYYAEAQFRRGEIFFSAQRYADAERAYQAVLGRRTGTGFRAAGALQARLVALQAVAGRPEQCRIPRPARRTAGRETARLRPAGSLSRAEQELTDDALRALAITFAAAEGPSLAAVRRSTAVAPRRTRHALYRALGDLYVEKERYQDAAGSLPGLCQAPAARPGGAAAARARHRSVWQGRIRVAGARRQARAASRTTVRAASSGPLHAGHRSGRERGGAVQPARSCAASPRARAAGRFGRGARGRRPLVPRLPGGFRHDPEAPATRLLLADLLFEGASYDEAAAEYERAAYGYPAGPQRVAPATRRLVAFEKAEAQLPGAAARRDCASARPSRRCASPIRSRSAGGARRARPAPRGRCSTRAIASAPRPSRSACSRSARARTRASSASRGPCSRTRISTHGDYRAGRAGLRRAGPRASAGQRPGARRHRRATGRHRSIARPRRARRAATSPAPCRSSCAWPWSRRRRPCGRRRNSMRRRCC